MADPKRAGVAYETCLSADPARQARVEKILRTAGIALAMVHGSRVQGRPRRDSDLDVGVLAAGGRPLAYSSMGAVASELSSVFGVEVDVSDLATPDAIFR